MFLNEYDEVQWAAISYLVGECNYGGRVTDDRDRRCLNSILDDYINPAVIEDPKHKFSGSANYPVPPKGTYDDYIQFIKVTLYYVINKDQYDLMFVWNVLESSDESAA